MFTEDDVKKIAKLSFLELSPEEISKFTKELAAVFGYVQKLQAYDVSQVQPTSHVHGSTNFFREDKVEPSMSTAEGLQNAPDRSGNFIRVPIIIEQSGEH